MRATPNVSCCRPRGKSLTHPSRHGMHPGGSLGDAKQDRRAAHRRPERPNVRPVALSASRSRETFPVPPSGRCGMPLHSSSLSPSAAPVTASDPPRHLDLPLNVAPTPSDVVSTPLPRAATTTLAGASLPPPPPPPLSLSPRRRRHPRCRQRSRRNDDVGNFWRRFCKALLRLIVRPSPAGSTLSTSLERHLQAPPAATSRRTLLAYILSIPGVLPTPRELSREVQIHYDKRGMEYRMRD